MKLKPLLCALCLALFAGAAYSQTPAQTLAQTPAEPAAATEEGEVVLVVGKRPGPGLWKVSKGEHVLWIFGAYSPLPKNIEWRSVELEQILARSQEYIAPPSASAQVGFFKGLTLLPHMIGLRKNPDGAQLRDLLPAQVYARWLVLKQKYLGNDEGIERERPIFAAEALFQGALRHSGLVTDRAVRARIDALVKQHGLRVTEPAVVLSMDDPGAAMKEFKRLPMDGASCFSTTLERLETDLDSMRVRANAWAKGDLDAIQKLSYADHEEACKAAMNNSAFIKGRAELQQVEERMREAWLTAAEKALATNTSSFSVLPLRHLLNPQGFVAALEAKGYRVDKPD